MPKKQSFTIQVEESLVVSRTVKAETIQEAVLEAKRISEDEVVTKPKTGWSEEWSNGSKVVGVLA